MGLPRGKLIILFACTPELSQSPSTEMKQSRGIPILQMGIQKFKNIWWFLLRWSQLRLEPRAPVPNGIWIQHDTSD